MGRKKRGKIITTDVVNLGVPNLPEEANERNNKDWIPFGSDNLFPNALALMGRRSPVHRGILNFKAIYNNGKGFVTSDARTEAYIENVNSKGESLHQVTKKLIRDYDFSGNAYLEIVTDSTRSFVNLFHKDTTKCRVSKDKSSILIHPNWGRVNRSKQLIKTLPLYPEFEQIDGQLRSIVHFKDYEPEFSSYGIPNWIAALDAAGIGYKTNKWNISRLDNAFQSSGVLVVDGDMSEDDADKLREDFKHEFTGEGNQGKVMLIVKQLGGEGTTFTPFNNQKEGDWLSLHTQSASDLVTAHNWFRSLSGIADNTGFDTDRIRNEYQIAKGTVIAEEQAFFLDTIKKVMVRELALNVEDLNYVNEPPIDLSDKIDIENTISKNERRLMLGYEAVEEMDVRQSLNGSQVDSMVRVVQASNEGSISKDAAKQMLIVSFALTEDEANEMLR